MNQCQLSTVKSSRGDQNGAAPIALLALLLVSPCVFAQTTAPAPTPMPLPKATSAAAAATPIAAPPADEISLDMVVHDKKNKAVLDLKPEDFAVTDSDTPVTLSKLRLRTGDASGQHMVTLLFDHLDPSQAKYASNIAARILKMVPSNGFEFSVTDVEGRLRLYQKFTTDHRTIQDAVDSASDGKLVGKPDAAAQPEKWLLSVAQTGVDPDGRHVDIQERAKAKMLLTALQDSQRIVQDQHSLPALACLLALARSQQQATERKTVIYFTQDSHMDSTAKNMVRSIVGAANRAGVTIYAIDVKGLDSDAQMQLMSTIAIGGANAATAAANSYAIMNPAPVGTAVIGTALGPGVAAQGDNFAGRIEISGLEGNANPLSVMAASTGGSYIDAADSMRKPLERMLQDMTTYYEATYVPSIDNYDGKFRPVVVKPIRAGLNIRARSGYFALAPGSGADIRPFEAPLLRILSGQQLPTDLKFHAAVLKLGDLPDGNTTAVVVEAPLSELELQQDYSTKLYSARLSIVAQVVDMTGTVVEHFSEDIPRHGALDAIDSARLESFTMQRHFTAAPGKYILEAAILDQNSGKASAQRVDFEIVPPPAGPSMSDLVLVRQMDAIRGEGDAIEPLRYANAKVMPNLSGTATVGPRDLSLFLILHPDPKSQDTPQLEMEVLRDGQLAGHMPLPMRAGVTSADGQVAIPYLASFRSSTLMDGQYEVKATFTQGAKASTQTISFKVDGGRTTKGPTEVAGPATAAESAGEHDLADTAAAKLAGDDAKPRPGQLLISSPTNPITAPGAAELKAVIDRARSRALDYGDSLPNFMCVEITNRSGEESGHGGWKHKDTIAELMRYKDGTETRTMLEVDGKRSSLDPDSLKGTFSYGEFVGVLNSVFRVESQADFHWKETDTLGSGTVQVFDYHVEKANSTFKVTGGDNTQLVAAFHGQVYIDSATQSVRRITMEAENLPKNFSIQGTSLGVDYDYIAINSHDYLMPVSGAVTLRKLHSGAERNEIEFRDYRRYGSEATLIMNAEPETKP